MVLSENDTKLIIDFVKKEPRSVQEISKLIKRSWVTTDTYIKNICDRTGLISVKTFRKGSQGALKVVFYNFSESLIGDSLKENLYNMIKNGKQKIDFDFMEIFQHVDDKKKRHLITEYNEGEVSHYENLATFFRQTKSKILCFSGNLSFINLKEKKLSMMELMEETVNRGVIIKVLCRINIASLNNISRLQRLMNKYPNAIEIRHCYQPLRGFIFDDGIARFKNEEQLKLYKKGELEKNTRIFYEIYDKEWVAWLEKVFWNLFRTSIDCEYRLKEIKKISG